jgi:hypothetical protein
MVSWADPITFTNFATDPTLGILLNHQLNSYIRDNQLFLRNRIATAVQAERVNVGEANWYTVSFDSDDPDNPSESVLFDNTEGLIWPGSGGALTAPVDGIYLLFYRGYWVIESTEFFRGVRLIVNRREKYHIPMSHQRPVGASASSTGLAFAEILRLRAGDSVEVEIIHDAEDDLELGVAEFGIAWMMAGTGPPTWVTPRTWQTTDVLNKTLLDRELKDNPNFLYKGVGAKALLDNDTAFSSGTSFQTVTFDVEAWDSGGCWSAVNGSRFTAPVDGWYLLTSAVRFDTDATGDRCARLRFNGAAGTVCPLQYVRSADFDVSVAVGTAINGAVLCQLDATEYAELQIWQNSGGSLDIHGSASEYGEQTRLSGIFLGGTGSASTWTAPRTWELGEKPTKALLDTHVKDNLLALYNPPACFVRRTSNQSLPSGTETKISWSTADLNRGSLWSAGSPTRMTADRAGLWLIWYVMTFAADATTYRRTIISVNDDERRTWSLEPVQAASQPTAFSGIYLVSLESGDYVEILGLSQTTVNVLPSSAALNLQTAAGLWFLGEL